MRLREGQRLGDVRFGEVEILAVTEKQVWYKFVRQGRVHRTSKRRAEEFLRYGPDWANNPRWYSH